MATYCMLTLFVALPASALLSVAFGAGLKTELSLSTAYSFTIQAVDAAGRNLTRGGDAAAWTVRIVLCLLLS